MENERKRQGATPERTSKKGKLASDSGEEIEFSTFNDPIHGSLQLNPVLVSIINTPQFQRLRDIKQLGASYWTYPGACHNRFEHSIGTSYLCGLMLKTLQKKHPELITDKEILCVEIAGLCHDLGHGPFSHVFDMQYKRRTFPDSEWTHEIGSINMFDHLVHEHESVQSIFHKKGIEDEEKILIKDLIIGKDPRKDEIKDERKWFLYEIVSNKRNGIDCDKFDYLMRDCYHVGMKSNFDCLRYFQNTRILSVDGQYQICVRDKERLNLYELFHMRWSLHHKVYQHKTTKIVEHMLVEALSMVDKKFEISEAINHMPRYTYLTDSILYEILRSRDSDENVKSAQKLINQLQSRQIYKFCGQVNAPLGSADDSQMTPSQQIVEKGEDGIALEVASMNDSLQPKDVVISIVNISYGMKSYDPIDYVIFYTKSLDPVRLRKEHISEVLPQTFREKLIRAYSKDPSKKELVEQSFDKWCQENGFYVPNVLDGDKSGYFTDVHKSSAIKQNISEERSNNLNENMAVKRSLIYS